MLLDLFFQDRSNVSTRPTTSFQSEKDVVGRVDTYQEQEWVEQWFQKYVHSYFGSLLPLHIPHQHRWYSMGTISHWNYQLHSDDVCPKWRKTWPATRQLGNRKGVPAKGNLSWNSKIPGERIYYPAIQKLQWADQLLRSASWWRVYARERPGGVSSTRKIRRDCE